MIKINTPGISDASLIDYDSNHSVTAKIDELVAKNSYAVCSTAGDTAAKTVTLSNFALGDDVQVVVKFANTNTASSPTLNINSTGAKPIKVNGESVGLSVIKANSVFLFAYDGTNYNIVGGVGGSDIFIGTMDEWDELTTAEKEEWDGKPVIITDDFSGEGGGTTVIADIEISPTERFHAEGSYLTFNHKEYICLTDIEIGTALDYEDGSLTQNIEEVALPDGTTILTDDGDGEGGSGGGHTIIDSSGTSMTARSGLKFGEGFNTADDSSNNQTVVTPNANVLAKQSEISDVILTGDKPSSAITEGKFFVDKNGLLRVATSSIGTTDDVDNTNSTVKSIGEVLGELNSNITANHLGNTVDISSYGEANPYVCPSEGYFQIVVDTTVSGSSITGRVQGTSGNNSFVLSAAATANMESQCYVRKGMRINVRSSSGTTYARFYPLT